MPEQKQRPEAEGGQAGAAFPGGGEPSGELEVEAEVVAEAACAALAGGAVELVGALAVGEVLAAVGGEGEGVAVVDEGVGDVAHGVAGFEPAGAEVAVFGGEAVAFVEAAEGEEGGAGEGHIVGGEEAGTGGVGVVEGVDDIDDELAGRGIGVGWKSVDGAAAEKRRG